MPQAPGVGGVTRQASGWPERKATLCLHERTGQVSLGLEALGWAGDHPSGLPCCSRSPSRTQHSRLTRYDRSGKRRQGVQGLCSNRCHTPRRSLLPQTRLSVHLPRSPRKQQLPSSPPGLTSDFRGVQGGRTYNSTSANKGPGCPLPWEEFSGKKKKQR